jgi:hypothetical protein
VTWDVRDTVLTQLHYLRGSIVPDAPPEVAAEYLRCNPLYVNDVVNELIGLGLAQNAERTIGLTRKGEEHDEHNYVMRQTSKMTSYIFSPDHANLPEISASLATKIGIGESARTERGKKIWAQFERKRRVENARGVGILLIIIFALFALLKLY